MIRFKDDKIRQQWESSELHPLMIIVVLYTAALMAIKYNVLAVITSIHRPGDKGVHGYWRGVDIRVHNLLAGEAKQLEAEINRHFQYDKARPEKKVAYLHGKGNNIHLHLQVYVGADRWGVAS